MTRLLAVAVLLLGALLSTMAGAEPNPQVLIKTNAGEIRLELFPAESPQAVANFLAYIDSGHYVGTVFHRVIPNFMIQGGGFTVEMIEKPVRDPVPNESGNHLHNERGTIAMARTEDPDSATAQFFINVRSNLRLDFDYVSRKPGYTVFGKVIGGMDVVDGIALVETRTVAAYDDVPLNPIIIEKAERIE